MWLIRIAKIIPTFMTENLGRHLVRLAVIIIATINHRPPTTSNVM